MDFFHQNPLPTIEGVFFQKHSGKIVFWLIFKKADILYSDLNCKLRFVMHRIQMQDLELSVN